MADDQEAARRREFAAQADKVMAESKPVPSQEEIDAIVRGEMHVDDKADPGNPEMPHVAEQQQAIREAKKPTPAPGPAPRQRETAKPAE